MGLLGIVHSLARVATACAFAAGLLPMEANGQPRCIDEDRSELPAPGAAASASSAASAPRAQPDPRGQLQTMVREALARSHQVGAARLLADAAEDDIRETRAAKAIQASVGGGLGPGGSQSLAGTETSAMQLRGSVNVGQLLYDGGRIDRLTDWRTQMAESARHGQLNVQEQLALSTVSLALERSRYRQHALVYGQYVRKMACLVEALQTIVRADRGRASELLQATKSLQQAEISLASSQSQLRQTEVKLRRLAGDNLPAPDGLPSVLLEVDALPQLVADVERSSEIAALTAQTQAMHHYVDAVAAGASPQVGWSVSGTQSIGRGGSRGSVRNGSYALGISVNIPLLSPGVPPATDAARKRARAAEMQRAEAIESRRFRVAEVHEQALASFDRVRRTAAVLRDSEQLRNATLQQWQQLGRRSLFDVMAAEADHFNLRVSYVNALTDGQQLNANLLSLGRGVSEWLR
ncbi:MAG: TolC family protein [Burkholderiales bacterium]|nr:TolC family protein [Burkholderiales bacterium]